jgi:hypothetical protein
MHIHVQIPKLIRKSKWEAGKLWLEPLDVRADADNRRMQIKNCDGDGSLQGCGLGTRQSTQILEFLF